MKKYRYFRYTGLLRRNKPIQLDTKNETHFTQSLEQNGMSLWPVSKSNKKRRKRFLKPKYR